MSSFLSYMGQIFYLILLCCGYGIVLFWGYPMLPNQYLTRHEIWTTSALTGCCLLVYLKLAFSDPGRITKDSVGIQYAYIHPLYLKTECRTCLIQKWARSKHCSTCNACIARFSHHCMWLNNCIGTQNYGLFMAFLLLQLITCTYGVYFITGLLMGTLAHAEEMEKEEMIAHLQHLALKASNRAGMCLGLICILCSVLLLVFIVFHVFLIYYNITPNEWVKQGRREEEEERMGPQLDASWGGIFNESKLCVKHSYVLPTVIENIRDAVFQDPYWKKGKQKNS